MSALRPNFRASLADLAGDCPALSGLTRRETAWQNANIANLVEIVRDLSRRVAACEIELAGRVSMRIDTCEDDD